MALICSCFSMAYMTMHHPSEEPWDSSAMDLERRYRLGSEVTSLSLLRSNSSDKSDPLEHLSLSFKLARSVK